jgi:hypothetical protein
MDDPVPERCEILARTGRSAEARAAAEQCLRVYEAKGIVPLIERAHAFLAELTP